MTQNPERVAWVVLLLAFAIFCLIIVAVPLGVRWYVRSAEVKHTASIETLAGTVIVEPPVGRGPVPLTKGQNMVASEGTLIRMDETSEGVVTFYDHSFMRLFPGTTLRLDRLRSPRYKWSPLPASVHLALLGGHVRIGTALSLASPLDFRVSTLQGESQLDADGSYAIEAWNNRSEVAVYRGRARLSASGGQVELGSRQRSLMLLNQPPQAPTGVAKNLVTNGEFGTTLGEGSGWRVFSDQGADGGTVDGHADMVVDEGRRAIKLWRTGGQGNHCETILEQKIDQQLPDPVTSLVVRATVKVRFQGLSGGGYLSSEYPLMIRITYRDVYDSETDWVQGFYYQNVSNNPTANGLQIPQDRWYLFESSNLLESLPIKPYKITKIRVYASGWDYESLISDISLVAE